MKKEGFQLPPISPFIGSTLSNFLNVIRNRIIERKYWLKIILTAAILTITIPFRWYESVVFKLKPKKVKKELIFIVGHWRSGTTFIHNLLCQDPDAAFVTTYQSVFPFFLASRKLFLPIMQAIMPQKRPSDNVELAARFPQEEEFALCNMTPYSYYSFFYFPQYYKEFYDSFLRGKSHQKALEEAYRNLIWKTDTVSKGNRLILKNPVNTARMVFLASLFPGARYIHIYRNPYIVYISTKKFFTELMPTLWFHQMSEEEIEELILETYVKMYTDYFNARELLSSDKLIEIRFEDFERDPNKSLHTIYKSLKIDGFEKAKPFLDDYINRQKSHKKNRHKITRRELKIVQSSWSEFLTTWNYDVPEDLEIID